MAARFILSQLGRIYFKRLDLRVFEYVFDGDGRDPCLEQVYIGKPPAPSLAAFLRDGRGAGGYARAMAYEAAWEPHFLNPRPSGAHNIPLHISELMRS